MTVATEPAVTPERRRAPRGSARQSIVAAATELFARRGYEATSVQEIVAAAEVTKGALYHWFGSKSELLTSIYRELLASRPGGWPRSRPATGRSGSGCAPRPSTWSSTPPNTWPS